MSPDLFNLCSEVILHELDDLPKVVEINNLRYADDTVLLAQSIKHLQKLFDTVVASSERLGLSVNSKKLR